MKTVPVIAFALLALAPPTPGDLSAEQRAEQRELLAWAQTLRYQGRSEQALALCEMILEADPGCVRAWIERGVLNLGERRLDEAREDFRRALKRDPGNALALVGRGHLYHALGEFDRADRDATKALERCNRLIAAESADADTWYARGLAKALLEDESALQDFVMAASLEPGHLDAHAERAGLYQARGRTQDALDQLTRAVQMRPDYAVGYLARARIQYEAGNLDESIADCDRALEVNPQYARAWHNRGLVNVRLGDTEAAIADFTAAISARPGYASAHFYRGQAYMAFGNTAAARADLEMAKELSPDQWPGPTAAELLRTLQGAAETRE